MVPPGSAIRKYRIHNRLDRYVMIMIRLSYLVR
jgi:hypothetical protein